MKNPWLAARRRPQIEKYIRAIIVRLMGHSGIPAAKLVLDESQVTKTVDYAISLLDRMSTSDMLDEMEQIVETTLTIDRNRFLKK